LGVAPVFTLVSQVSPQEKPEGFRLTRFFGVLASTVIRVYSPGMGSPKREAGRSNQVAEVSSPPGFFAPSGHRGLVGNAVRKRCLPLE
jgi:hypothetical protein